MYKRIIFLAAIFLSTILISCNWLSTGNENSGGKGSVLVAISLENTNTSNSQNLRATVATNLILKILDDTDNLFVRKDTSIVGGGVIFCEMGEIPADKECKIIAWTEDAAGVVIHSPDTQTVIAEANENVNTVLSLRPRVGSIAAQFAGVPKTVVDSFFFAFDSDSGFFETRVPRAVNTYLTLDNVPYDAKGNLSLQVTKKDGDFLADWDTLFTFLRENISLEFSFLSNGGLDVSVNIDDIYNTIITGFGDPSLVLGQETNKGVVITEFSYNYGTNHNFVEIANLSDDEISFNDLSVEVVGSTKSSATVKDISLQPQEALVFANTNSTEFWEPLGVNIFGNLYLTSTGSIIMIKGDGELLDYVMYVNDNSSTWVKPSTRTSLYLATKNSTPKFNNDPRNWKVSTATFVDDATTYYGNPGEL